MKAVQQHIQDLFGLFFPQVCLACGQRLNESESVICLACQHFLPKTYFHEDPENPVFQLFWGRVPLYFATAYYYVRKESRVQRLLHHVRYTHRPEVGEKIGQLFGQELKNNKFYNSVECIVPVPLHPVKERRRGFNQSAAFARGLAEGMEVPWSEHALLRTEHTPSQTRKKRFERWQNVARKFELGATHAISRKHVMLVDDVVTTGSTLESCSRTLLQTADKVSIATIAYATKT
jgi:ComF family protein